MSCHVEVLMTALFEIGLKLTVLCQAMKWVCTCEVYAKVGQ